MTGAALFWFREDLRLADNPALHAAVAGGRPVVLLFVLDERSGGPRVRGAAARWWLHGSLADLTAAIEAKGGTLHLYRGDAGEIVPAVARAAGATAAFWNRRYDKAGRAQDEAIEAALAAAGCTVETGNGKLLADPATMRTKTGTPFRVFGPFKRALLARGEPPALLPAPRRLVPAPLSKEAPPPAALADLRLLPSAPDWAGGLRQTWKPGEGSAGKRLHAFLAEAPESYAQGRDRPAQDASSRLSPRLASGELCSGQLWHAAHHRVQADVKAGAGIEKFVSELAWRDFAYHLLLSNPDLATKNFNSRFDDFPWKPGTPEQLRAWQTGTTGYPIVDAGMRQLWVTGWMHNRVRLITSSFLVKHLLIDWRVGEAWFWDTLCDADPANNAMNWQWIAGSGPDAAPYFRIFNPVLQGEKFDPRGDYVKQWVPELRSVPARFIHRPWSAPADVMAGANATVGTDYPAPIVVHEQAREDALAAFRRMRG